MKLPQCRQKVGIVEMWISRKKYKELIEELESLRVYAQIFDDYLKNSMDLAGEKFNEHLKEIKKEIEEDAYNEKDILKAIIDSDTTTRTKICDEIGITFKTLRNVVNGKSVKPSTREKIRKYIYTKQGSIKKEVLDKISKTTRQE